MSATLPRDVMETRFTAPGEGGHRPKLAGTSLNGSKLESYFASSSLVPARNQVNNVERSCFSASTAPAHSSRVCGV